MDFIDNIHFGISREALFEKLGSQIFNKIIPAEGFIDVVDFFLNEKPKTFTTGNFTYFYKYVINENGTFLLITRKAAKTREYVYLEFDKSDKLKKCYWDYNVSLWFAA